MKHLHSLKSPVITGMLKNDCWITYSSSTSTVIWNPLKLLKTDLVFGYEKISITSWKSDKGTSKEKCFFSAIISSFHLLLNLLFPNSTSFSFFASPELPPTDSTSSDHFNMFFPPESYIHQYAEEFMAGLQVQHVRTSPIKFNRYHFHLALEPASLRKCQGWRNKAF